jgi:hypothetical protein
MDLLPNEMLCNICAYLSNKDFLSILMACKKFSDNPYLIKEIECRIQKLDWREMSLNSTWNEIFIEKYYDHFYNSTLFMNKIFSESFLRTNSYRLDWNIVSCTQILSESFIREFKDEVNWKYISRWQNLSEPFLEEFKDKIYFHRISMYQKVSKAFIQKYKDKISWQGLIKF